MIKRLLPTGVAHAEAFEDVPGSTVFPAEVAVLTRAAPKRRREFTTVRHCTRQALGRLGFPPFTVVAVSGW
jgi:enterobactin synthetase component D / holo-[acyl-carrier protein] synthase